MLECYTEEGEGMGKEHEQSGLEVVGRGVAVVLAAREVARLRPVARVVVLLVVLSRFDDVFVQIRNSTNSTDRPLA